MFCAARFGPCAVRAQDIPLHGAFAEEGLRAEARQRHVSAPQGQAVSAGRSIFSPGRREQEGSEADDVEETFAGSQAEASERCQQELERLRTVIDGVPCAVVTVDLEGRIVSANRSAIILFDCAAGELLGSLLFERIESPLLREFIGHDGGSPRRSTCAGRLRSLKGRTLPVDLVIDAPLRGEHLAVVITAGDGADRHRLQRDVLDMRERERRRIGRDLHDSLGQQMVGLGMLVRNLARRLRERDAEMAASAERAVEIIDDMVTQTRDLARGLYPVELETKGLVQALRVLATQTSEHTGVRVELRVQEKRPLEIPTEVASQLYRIAQEALTNAVRHGHPQSILVRVSVDETRLELAIIDDGRGLPTEASRRDGMGLRLMTERATIMGAALTVGSDGDRGTRVCCIVPLATAL